MNHPCPTWKSNRTQKLLTVKSEDKVLDRHVRFKGLKAGDELDHERCYIWELNRTRIFLGKGLELDEIDEDDEYAKSFTAHPFPFYISSFPLKSYLDHDYEIRRKWTLVKGEETKNYEDDLLTPFEHLNDEQKPCVHKLPMELYINPSWNKTKFHRLVREQTNEIYRRLNISKSIYEQNGLETLPSDDSQNIRFWRKKLKVLGHLRLFKCVGLAEEHVREFYGYDSYDDLDSLKRAIKENLPFL